MVVLEQAVYWSSKVTDTLSLVTGLPGPVTRILTSIISYYCTRSIGDQLFGHCLSESSLSPGPVLSSNTSIEFKSYRSNIYLILAQYPLTLTNQDLHMPKSQPHVAPQHRPSQDSSWANPRQMS